MSIIKLFAQTSPFPIKPELRSRLGLDTNEPGWIRAHQIKDPQHRILEVSHPLIARGFMGGLTSRVILHDEIIPDAALGKSVRQFYEDSKAAHLLRVIDEVMAKSTGVIDVALRGRERLIPTRLFVALGDCMLSQNKDMPHVNLMLNAGLPEEGLNGYYIMRNEPVPLPGPAPAT